MDAVVQTLKEMIFGVRSERLAALGADSARYERPQHDAQPVNPDLRHVGQGFGVMRRSVFGCGSLLSGISG